MEKIRYYGRIHEHLDTDDATERIRSSIWFRGPNVYILAFSIIIASVGLNINSTAVIIGAMLISPLMGPIIGIGLSVGINDTKLLTDSIRNLAVMVMISLVVSTLFFLLSPLNLSSHPELDARTSPTIYDVLIALFGGFAGIFENSRKERGTVLSGVAIATALMPPLCTAGYGLANWNGHYFFGAMYLFLINCVFIILATYLSVKYLRFKTVRGIDEKTAIKRRRMMTALIIAFIIPSVWNLIVLVADNNFARSAEALVHENRLTGRSYIYDWTVTKGRHRSLVLEIGGEPLSKENRTLLETRADEYGIRADRLVINDRSTPGGLSEDLLEQMLDNVYTRSEELISSKDAEIVRLEGRLDSLSAEIAALKETSKGTDSTAAAIPPAAEKEDGNGL